LDRILNIFHETILANPLYKLKIQDLTQDHIIRLIKLTAENPISRANFAPLFVVGIHGEALTSQEIYQDQRVVTVIPDIERETVHKILTLSDIVPLDIYAVEHRGQIYVRKVASNTSHSEFKDKLSQYENGVLSLEALSQDLQTIERDSFI
jgi:Glu-tRNA(Gln) amidotransferase subunit E-like FAD-binding protein